MESTGIQFRYRPDVDGLRAVAVVLVLLFHAHLGTPGGYVGVDVFFVISGYLIAGLILQQLEQQRFTIGGFFARRIRRIVPAVAVVATACLLAGAFLLVPFDWVQLAKSTIAQQLLVSNLYFWSETGYFGAAAEAQPLLHTWSLAVEEQFYLGFPVLLMLCHRYARRLLWPLLLAVAVVSFAWSVSRVTHVRVSAFYLLPSRTWELLLGALLWRCPRPKSMPAVMPEALAWLGLAAIGYAAVEYGRSTPFPGTAALAPCLGTAAIIYANGCRRTSLGRLLELRPVVFVGLLSYSLYLWHWPLFAFQFCRTGEAPGVTASVVTCLLSLVLAWVSWKFVEQPFRKSGTMRLRVPLIAALTSSAVIIGLAFAVVRTDGLAGRWGEDARFAMRDHDLPRLATSLPKARRGEFQTLGDAQDPEAPIDFLVWGDSHALATGALFDTLAREHGLHGVLAARPATLPLLLTRRADASNVPIAWNAAVARFVTTRKIRNVILVGRWTVNLYERPLIDAASRGASPATPRGAVERGLQRTLAALRAAGVQTWVCKQVPLQPVDVQRQFAYAAFTGTDEPAGVTIDAHRARQEIANAILDTARATDVHVLDPEPFCFDTNGVARIRTDDGALYVDSHHLSPLGAEALLRPLFEPVMQSIRDSR